MLSTNLNVGKFSVFPQSRHLHKVTRPNTRSSSFHQRQKPRSPNPKLNTSQKYPTTTNNLQRKFPWVELNYLRDHPCMYPNMIKAASPDAIGGSLVNVYGPDSNIPYGVGLFNPIARVPLRIIHHGTTPFTESDFIPLLDTAVTLRQTQLHLHETTNTYRVIHSDGDGLSGLIVDRYADVLSVGVHSLGMWQRLPLWIPHLHERLGTRRAIVDVDPGVAGLEGIDVEILRFDDVQAVCVNENGVRYEVNFAKGHKTGFFCDQRDNRFQFTKLTKGRNILDLCCYTGGFSLSSKVQGGALNVTGVDLDPIAITQARRNAKLNRTDLQLIHADAFSFAREMIQKGKTWEVVVLDPPKFILSRDDGGVGLRKYADLNELVVKLVDVGGILVTCSCSGLISGEEFEKVVINAAHQAGRRLQILGRSGAGKDHPIMSNCPESQYLKVLWLRVI